MRRRNQFPRGHKQTKELIQSCAVNGVTIDSLPDAPSFRFIPIDLDPNKPRHDGPPSGRGSLAVGKNRYGCKNWTPAPIDLNPMYNVPMTGNSHEFNEARRSWYRGNPNPLRKHLEGMKQ